MGGEDREEYVRSEHVTQRMILLDDFERGSVWDFGVFRYFDPGEHHSLKMGSLHGHGTRTASRHLRERIVRIDLVHS